MKTGRTSCMRLSAELSAFGLARVRVRRVRRSVGSRYSARRQYDFLEQTHVYSQRLWSLGAVLTKQQSTATGAELRVKLVVGLRYDVGMCAPGMLSDDLQLTGQCAK